MIFVTVGAQMPFPRLVDAVDEWAAGTGRDDVFAQIGDQPDPPSHIRWERSLTPDRFSAAVEECDFMVAHAGMGSIITALTTGTPLVMMARRADRRETRNDHQIATAEHFGSRAGIQVAADGEELHELLERGAPPRPDRIGPSASEELLEFVEGFVSTAPTRGLVHRWPARPHR